MVKLEEVRARFLKAVQNFPRWMSVRKRPEKSMTGHFLLSIIEEQDFIAEELRQFISEFFLISYVDRESEIADYVYIAQVGNLTDLSSVSLISPELDIVQNPKYFLANIETCCLYQDGYFLISTNNVPNNESLIYEIAGYKYSSKLQRYHIWNIFDEFAMFLGLERYIDDNETNAQLLRRCFLVFARPTNSTAFGLKNVIRNCVDNDMKIEEDEISIEIPDDNNVWTPTENYDTVYEKLAQLNKDVLRTKVWGKNQWQHNFKTLGYLSHQWDKELEVYQDGVGQNGDLRVYISGDEPETTRVKIQPYIYDAVVINEHCRKQRLQRRIPLTFKRYKDILIGQNVQYRITAYPVEQIDPSYIYLREETKTAGIQQYYLQDFITDNNIISSTDTRMIPAFAILEKDKEYKLVFTSSESYGDMYIERARLYQPNGNFTDILRNEHLSDIDRAAKEKSMGVFKFDGDILRHTGVLTHIQRVADAKNYSNLKDILVNDTVAIALDSALREAWMTVDVTGMGGEALRINTTSEMYDITPHTSEWTFDGLEIEDHKLVSKTTTVDNGTAILTTNCIGFSLTLESDTDQGTASISVYVNDVYDPTLSKKVLSPDVEVTARFEQRSKLQIVFKKEGQYPFKIRDIKTTNFDIECSLTTGELQHKVGYFVLPDVPDNVHNTLTIKIKNYDLISPIIRSVHIGAATTRRSYTIEKIIPNTDGCYLDVRTCCNVALYEVSEEIIGNRKRVSSSLITNNLDTSWVFMNNTTATLRIPIDLSNFSEIVSSDINIEKTVYNGVITAYITLAPGYSASKIMITGVTRRNVARRNIMTLLGIDTTLEQVYVSRGAPGFIIKTISNGKTRIATIDRKRLTKADTFTYEGLTDTAIGVFYHDRPKEDIEYNNNTDRNFEDTYLTLKSESSSIAYNEIDMYTPIYGDNEELSIVNTWYPSLENNKLYFYQISEIISDLSANAVFKKENNAYVLTPNQRKGLSIFRDKIISEIGFDTLNELSRVTVNSYISALKTDYDITVVLNIDEDTLKPLYDRVQSLLNDGSWSLGLSKLYVTADFTFDNVDSYDVEIDGSDKIFSLSNNIKLPETIDINGETHFLSEFVIEPPDYLTLKYTTECGTYREPYSNTTSDRYSTINMYVEEDGFNKLSYSNVINNENFVIRLYKNNAWVVYPRYETLSDNTVKVNYKVLEDEGIIVWENIDAVKGLPFRVEYDYKIPDSLEFRRLQDLYEIVNYNLEAYLPVGNIIEVKVGDREEFYHNENILISFPEYKGKILKPDYVRLECSNPNFVASYSNGVVYVTKAYTKNVALIDTGYYYDGPREFFYYNNLYTKKIEWYKGVTFHNVKKLDTIFILNMASSNYLLHTDFAPGHLWWELCHVGFADPMVRSEGISALNITTACESLNDWHTNNMVISFVSGINGLATMFSEEDRTGYAVLNITKHIVPDNLLSLFATNNIEVSIYKEIKIPHRIQEDGQWIDFEDNLPKTFFCGPFAEFTQSGNYLGYKVPEDISQEYQYYLVVRGNGIIDDIVSRIDVDISQQDSLHIKVVDDFAFNISEKAITGNTFYLNFDKEHCEVNDLEIAKDGTIGVASTVDYGLTKVYDSNIDYDNVKFTSTVLRRKESFITTDRSGTITTPKVFVDNYANAIECIVKVNDIIIGPMKNFNIRLYGSNGADKAVTLISQKSKTNAAIFVPEQSYSHIQVEVDMDPNKQISSVEIFMRYAENDKTALSITDYSHGILYTKVYDMVTPSDYTLKDIMSDTDIFESTTIIEEEKEESSDTIRDVSIIATNDIAEEISEETPVYYSYQIRGGKKDDRGVMWTQWYNYEDKYIFKECQFFQFRVFINSSRVKLKISQFIMEVA